VFFAFIVTAVLWFNSNMSEFSVWIVVDFSATVVYIRGDEWLIMQQLFDADIELRREIKVKDGKLTGVFIPGSAALF